MKATLSTLKRTSLVLTAWLAATLILALPVVQTYAELGRDLA